VRELYVRELRISRRVAEKILAKHGLHEDEIRATIEEQGGWSFVWHRHPVRGWRAIVQATIRDTECLIVLYPANDELADVWNLGSAYPDERTE
jgi:hypothetical protein